MAINFYKRVKMNDGVGVNISKSGISTSFRGKYGSFGTKGFSIRTGIPGMTLRHNWSGTNKLSNLLIFLLFIVIVGAIYILMLAVYNIFLLIIDIVKNLSRVIRIKTLDNKLKRHKEQIKDLKNYSLVSFDESSLPKSLQGKKIYLNKILKNKEFVEKDTLVGEIIIEDKIGKIYAPKSGIIVWYKIIGQRILEDETISIIESIET